VAIGRKPLDQNVSDGYCSCVSTVAEIERAIEQLPPEQRAEIRRWMDRQFPKGSGSAPAAKLAEFDAWLAHSTGIAEGRFTTDERMRDTRGED
jgi:hypothetical protein